MKIKNKLYVSLIFTFFLIFINLVWSQDPSDTGAKGVVISTDKQEYNIGETVRVIIQNNKEKEVDICCLSFCTMGNFPTVVEAYRNEEWKFLCGHCLLLERFFQEEGVIDQQKDKYFICYKLTVKESLEFEINEFCNNQHLNKDDRVRITYYMGRRKTPIHSNEFTIK